MKETSTADQYASKGAKSAKAGDKANAIACYRQAIDIDAKQPPWVYAGLANLLLQDNRVKEAEEAFKTLREKYPRQPQGFAGLAQAAQRRQHWVLALERWNDCLTKFPQHAPPLWYASKGNALLQLGRIKESEQLYQNLLRSHPEQMQGLAGLAQVAQLRQDWEAALEKWEAVIAAFPQQLNAHIQRGNVLLQLERVEKAEAVFQQAAEKWPELPGPLYGLARVAQYKKKYKLSVKIYHKASERFPENLHVRAEYIRSLLKIFDFDKAHEVYSTTAENVQDPIFLSTLADIHMAEGNWPAAAKMMHDLCATTPDHLVLRLKQANILIQVSIALVDSSYMNQAIEVLEQLVAKFPLYLPAQLRLADAYIHAGRNQDAYRIIDRLPDNYHSHKQILALKSWRNLESTGNPGKQRCSADGQNVEAKLHSLNSVTCILGMHRSGTSYLTGTLEEAGLFLGYVNKYNPFNRKGNRENTLINRLHDDLLTYNGGSWDKPPERVVWTDEFRRQRDKIIAGYAEKLPWGFKDPRTLLVLDGWLEALPNVSFVGIFRHPAAVSASLARRNQFSFERGVDLWVRYNKKLLLYKHRFDFPLIEFVREPAILRQKTSILLRHIGLLLPPEEHTFFDGSLQNQKSTEDNSTLPVEAVDIYENLRSLAL